MKDKNSLIGWLLIILVFIGYTVYTARQQKQRAERMALEQATEQVAQQKSDSVAAVVAQQRRDSIAVQTSDSTNVFFRARQGQHGLTTLENDLLRVSIANAGAQVARVELLDETYKNQKGGQVVLFDEGDATMRLLLEGKEINILSDEFCFTPSQTNDSTLVMTLPVGSGELCVTYTLVPGSYLLRMSVRAQGIEGLFSPKTRQMDILWEEHVRGQEKGRNFESRYSTITYRRVNGGTKTLSSGGADKEKDGDDLKNPMRWVAYKTQFFSRIFIADSLLSVDRMSSRQSDELSGYLKTYRTQMSTFFDPQGEAPSTFAFYFGPNKFSTLARNEDILSADSHLDLQSIVYLGWPILRWINRYIFLYLFDFMTGWGLNMGIILLLITLIVKFAVFPLMRKSYLASANMRVLKPKVDEIAKQYPKPEDAMQKQQAMMQLYSEYGVSPMGGCLPMLIQMPIWIALFNFIPNAIELRGQSFLWANDLSTYDDLIHWGTRIWLIGDHISLFCVLWCASTIANTMISMKQQSYAAMSDEQVQSMRMMKWMSYIMPLIFFFSFNSYSAGLNYYYFISGLLTILMMWYLRRTTDDAKLLAKLEARHKKRKATPRTTGGSSMMSRLQRMAEQQQEILRQQQEQQRKKR